MHRNVGDVLSPRYPWKNPVILRKSAGVFLDLLYRQTVVNVPRIFTICKYAVYCMGLTKTHQRILGISYCFWIFIYAYTAADVPK
jgi:hypothetical protein